MTTALAKNQDKMLALLSTGDMKALSPDERLAYFKARCEHAGLDPLSAPFEWMTLQGKLTLYAKKTATDQLSSLHKLKVTIVSDKVIADAVYVVRARAEAPDGRVKEEDGAVPIKGLDPQALANAVMKASTKAARRAVLSITGLSMLDETEVESIPAPAPVVADRRRPPRADGHSPAPGARGARPGHGPARDGRPAPEEDDGDEELDIVTATRLRIQATKTLAALLVVGGDIKKMPAEVRESLRQDYADQQARIKEGK